MKYLLLLLLFAGCSKQETLPEYVDVNIYVSKLENTNFNEPNLLYTYVYTKANDRYYIANTTDLNMDVATLEFYPQFMFPSHLYSGYKLKTVTVKRILITKE